MRSMPGQDVWCDKDSTLDGVEIVLSSPFPRIWRILRWLVLFRLKPRNSRNTRKPAGGKGSSATWPSGKAGCVHESKRLRRQRDGRPGTECFARGISLTPRFSEVCAGVGRSEPFQRFSGLRQVSHSAGTRSRGAIEKPLKRFRGVASALSPPNGGVNEIAEDLYPAPLGAVGWERRGVGGGRNGVRLSSGAARLERGSVPLCRPQGSRAGA